MFQQSPVTESVGYIDCHLAVIVYAPCPHIAPRDLTKQSFLLSAPPPISMSCCCNVRLDMLYFLHMALFLLLLYAL